MKFNLRAFLIVLLAAPVVFWAVHLFTGKIYADKVALEVVLKAYSSSKICLFYNDVSDEFSLNQSDEKMLMASQFYKRLVFDIPETRYIAHTRLDMEDDENQIFIQSISLTLKGAFKDTTIKRWSGTELKELILLFHGAKMTSANAQYIQIATTEDDPYLLFNKQFAEQLQAFYKANGTQRGAQLTATVVFTIFLLAVCYFCLSYIPISGAGFKRFVAQGGVLIIGGVSIIGLVFLNNRFQFIKSDASQENRILASKPTLTTYNFFSYPDEYANYAKDHFSFRNDLFFLHSLYMTKVFGTSPMPDDLLMGKDGWFFDNEPGCISDARRLTLVSEGELSQIYKNMSEKKRWLDARGIKFYVIIPPNKQSVYPEKMPIGYFETEGIGVNRLELYKLHLAAHAGINLVNPTDALRIAKHRREVYYKTDTHWNLFGGFIGYGELMKEICKDFPNLHPATEDEFHFTSFMNNEGDLARVAGLGDVYKRTEQSLTFKNPAKVLQLPRMSEIVIRYEDNPTVDSSELKLLMLRDSYANYLIPFLNLHFKKAVYLWSYDFPDKVIDTEKPDVVIFESLQRFMAMSFASPNPDGVSDTTSVLPAQKLTMK